MLPEDSIHDAQNLLVRQVVIDFQINPALQSRFAEGRPGLKLRLEFQVFGLKGHEPSLTRASPIFDLLLALIEGCGGDAGEDQDIG
jgi:hypothetical protein